MPKAKEQMQAETALAIRDDNSLRCCCGSLLARIIPNGVELKCRRCKRCVIVPFKAKGTVEIGM